MVRKEMFVEEETCSNCESTEKSDIELIDIEINDNTNKHTETHHCKNCGVKGTIEYTPPAGAYKLKGNLFES
jgi:hypothetical protein